ncbi:response regulator [Plantactinospora solaniradicis]|uniref:Response regulator n=1 Tax=Plantactinospora solaniradicis TaxID=1723736 RepID=A0ABW1KRM5_9ACTN
MPDKPVRVLIADDHPVFREGLAVLLSAIPGVEVVGTAADGTAAERATTELAPDVILMDVAMPGLNGVEATQRILATTPNLAVLMLTMSADNATLLAALRAGATGYLLKDAGPEEISRAIMAAANGEAIFGPAMARQVTNLFTHQAAAPPPPVFPQLTAREHEILVLIAKGLTNSQIARRLCLASKTIRNNVSHILTKLQVADRAEAIDVARRAGLA